MIAHFGRFFNPHTNYAQRQRRKIGNISGNPCAMPRILCSRTIILRRIFGVRVKPFVLLFLLVVPVGAGMTHDGILYSIRIGNGAEEKVFLFAGALDMDIAVIEEGLEEPMDFHGNILDAGELELAHFPREEPALLDIDDAVIGDDPDVEPDIDPGEKRVEPGEEKDGVLDKEEKRAVFGGEEVGEEDGERDEGEEEHPHEEDDGEEVYQDIEPVPVGYLENALFGSEKIIE